MAPRLRTDDAIRDLPPALLEELVGIVGANHVRTDGSAVAEAGQDWWPITLVWARHGEQAALPAAVVRPDTLEEVAAVLSACNRRRIPVTPFAGRSGVCGGSLPVRGGVSLDLCRLDRVHGVDADDLVAHTDAGVYGPVFEQACNDVHTTCGHFPQSFDISTVGGWIACRGAGQYSNRYGKIDDMVLGLEVALADGRTLRTNPQPAAATGPDLNRIFIGSEGTLGVITSAWLRVWPEPPTSGRQAWSFDRLADALDAMRQVMRRGVRPACLRLYDGPESARHFGLGDTRNAVIVLTEGDPATVAVELAVVEECFTAFGDAVVREDDAHVDHWLEHRNDVSALHTVIERNVVVDTIEVAAPWSKLAGLYAAVQSAVFAAGDGSTLVCTAHSSHAYLSGACLYFTFAGRPGDDLLAKDGFYGRCWDAAMRAVRESGGTISHHHGIGIVRSRHLHDELGAGGMGVLSSVKDALDPNRILNPGKLGLGPELWPPAPAV